MRSCNKSKLNLVNLPVSCIFGILNIVISWTSAIISISLAPAPFNPLNNYMSNLGNSSLNPDGAIIYNSSVIISGILFIIFFIGLYQWYTSLITDKILLKSTQILGILLSFTIIMTGIFSEDFKRQHIFWSIIAGILGFLVNVSIALYLFKQRESNKIISYTIIALIGLYIILLFIISTKNVLTEWVVRILGDISLILMIYNFNRIYQIRTKSIE
ncbi:MAG: DUF998 domain-containing protein [Candidatus Thorarchaeota archaeon]